MALNLRDSAAECVLRAISSRPAGINSRWRTSILVAIAIAVTARPALPSQATSYTHRSWRTEDGLPANRVRAVAQDRDGYLWVGTDLGLARFDGVKFTVWDSHGASAASRVGVLAICAASDGSLWISFPGQAGVDRIRGDSISTFRPSDGLIAGSVLVFLQDRRGQIWAGGRGGLSAFRDGKWRLITLGPGLEDSTVTTLFEDQGGRLWISTSVGVFTQQGGTDTFAKVEVPESIAQGFIPDANGQISVLDRNFNLRPIVLGGARSSQYTFADRLSVGWGLPMRVFADSRRYLWVAVRGKGLMRVDPNARQPLEFFSVENGLPGVDVSTFFEDREGSLWVGTADGLAQFSAGTITNLLSSAELPAPRVLTTAQDGAVWIGTDVGLVRSFGHEMTRYSSRDGLPNVRILALHADQRGTIWIATVEGLVRYWQGKFQRVALPIALKNISVLTIDQDGRLWIADREKGLYWWDGHRLTNVAHPADLLYQQVSSFHVDKRGRVWIGFFSGTVAWYDGRQLHYSYAQKGPPRGAVISIIEDTDDLFLLVTTTGFSWIRADLPTTLSIPDSVPMSPLTAAVEAANGDLWIGAGDRILRIDYKDRPNLKQHPSFSRYSLYDASDGLLGGVTSFVAFPKLAVDHADNLWCITTSGIAVVERSTNTAQYRPPIVTIDTISVDDHQIRPTSVFRLPRGFSRLQFDYSVVSLRAYKKLRVQYKLDGFDSAWVDTGTNRRVAYSALRPGHYRFRIKANIQGADWTEAGAASEFDVPAAYYQTYWFATACVMTIGMIVWGAWQFRVRQIRSRFALVMAERTRMAREIHDTLLQSLVGLGLHLDNVSDGLQRYSNEDLKDQLKSIRKQVEDGVIDARLSILNMRRPVQAPRKLNHALRELGGRITKDTALRLSVRVHGSASPMPPFEQEQLLRIVQEAVNNAVRHSGGTAIELDAYHSGRSVRVRIRDNGRGFEVDRVAHARGHWGITFMRERAQQIGAEIDIMSSPSEGTIVECNVPLSKTK
jgi:signal transduction histidine kinase